MTTKQLRELAARDQSEAAKRDGHRCTYSCDCDCEVVTVVVPPEAIAAGVEYIDSLPPEPLDSAHCPRDESSGPARFSGVMCCVAIVALFWILVFCAAFEGCTR